MGFKNITWKISRMYPKKTKQIPFSTLCIVNKDHLRRMKLDSIIQMLSVTAHMKKVVLEKESIILNAINIILQGLKFHIFF